MFVALSSASTSTHGQQQSQKIALINNLNFSVEVANSHCPPIRYSLIVCTNRGVSVLWGECAHAYAYLTGEISMRHTTINNINELVTGTEQFNMEISAPRQKQREREGQRGMDMDREMEAEGSEEINIHIKNNHRNDNTFSILNRF